MESIISVVESALITASKIANLSCSFNSFFEGDLDDAPCRNFATKFGARLTRMVQLPATAAIEYVAAGHFFPGGLLAGGIFVRGCFCPGVFFPGDFFPGGLLPGGTFGRGIFVRGAFVRGVLCPGELLSWGAYARSPQVQCVYAPYRLSVRSVTNKHKNRQTRPRSSAGSRPPLPKFSGYVEVEAHYIFHLSTIWVRPLFTELGPKNPPKSRFCHEANEYMSP